MKIKILLLLIFFNNFCLATKQNIQEQDEDIFALIDNLFGQDEEPNNIKNKFNLNINTPENNIKTNTQDKIQELKNKVELKSIKSFQDFTVHFDKYYPNAFLIKENFLTNMTPDKIAISLEKLINCIAYTPWLYIENIFKVISKKLSEKDKELLAKNNFDISVIEDIFKNINLKKVLQQDNCEQKFIAEQLKILSEFIKYSRVNLKTNIVYYDRTSGYKASFNKKQENDFLKNQTLIEYWESKNIKVHYDFYELCFDYFTRLFIEKIEQEDYKKAADYNTYLKEIFKKLENSPIEPVINLYLNKYDSLIKILRDKYNSEKFSFLKGNPQLTELLDYWGD